MSGFTGRDVPDQSGRTFVVTGANAGIGFGISRVLAGKGRGFSWAAATPARPMPPSPGSAPRRSPGSMA